ncbi:hypothetical protein [Streptomyces sp. ICC4]|uniref:hypothetical protein n=1 Tax=Streptomyces sp. ICC4 TaxID=2099584 RepID=UPI000DC7D5A9|nr:hypothetical protein [Streptomyces sp. ICC4]AWZ07848.1 hypothetical protein DRB89_28185 [Streptomyces sp. ICC4]
MDVESVAVELYGLRPAEFTAARDAYAAQAREAGDKQLAALIAALRKPTVAVWTAGLLARRRPEEARGLVQLGEALRSAHRTLDAGELRKLSHDQHVVIGELARTARALAAEAGQPVSGPVLYEVEQILHAVLADAGVAERWAAGRLAKAPDAVSGFAGLEPLPAAALARREQAARPAGAAAERVRPPRPDADDGRAGAVRRERAEAVRRERAEAARAELAGARAEAERLEAARSAAQELADRAAAVVEAAEEDVRAAGERLEAARAAGADAVAGHREAGRAAEQAKARVREAARKAEKLTSPER